MTLTPDYTLRRSTVLALTAALFLAYGIVGAVFGSSKAIEAFNVFVFALALGTAATYWSDFRLALRKPLFLAEDTLAYGIFVGWSAIAVGRGIGIIWRAAGRPDSWETNLLWGVHIAGSSVAATCHLLAPFAVGGRIPGREKLKLGLIVAAAALILASLYTIGPVAAAKIKSG